MLTTTRLLENRPTHFSRKSRMLRRCQCTWTKNWWRRWTSVMRDCCRSATWGTSSRLSMWRLRIIRRLRICRGSSKTRQTNPLKTSTWNGEPICPVKCKAIYRPVKSSKCSKTTLSVSIPKKRSKTPRTRIRRKTTKRRRNARRSLHSPYPTGLSNSMPLESRSRWSTSFRRMPKSYSSTRTSWLAPKNNSSGLRKRSITGRCCRTRQMKRLRRERWRRNRRRRSEI